ncbi:unnamed protein product [Hymenolepis diminuta]|uniref:Uncharacterized protein n=1 Tax=Hymenolepis diminuta TaxID=6216 RepID=A0A564YSK9_HYMDI|nr:unnamed protein product [Hymenolepis diminuta]
MKRCSKQLHKVKSRLNSIIIRISCAPRQRLRDLTLIYLSEPILGTPLLILMDSYSKWPEVISIKSTAPGIRNIRAYQVSVQKCRLILFYSV